MSQMESLREKLYKVMESGNYEDVLKVSQELDSLILCFMQKNDLSKKITA